jgi:phage FluMu protein Com
MLNDELCNNFFEKFYLPQDKIIIANQKLKEYLQKKIPNASFVNSTTLSVIDPDKVNELSRIDEYVIYYSKNLDDEYLKSLLYKDNLEILCGEFCVPNCPARTEHYKAISMSYKGDNSLLDEFELSQKCPRKNELNGLTISEVAK